MILTLEMKKLKRTGFLPAIFLGSLFACAFPLANTALRPELFVQQELPATPELFLGNAIQSRIESRPAKRDTQRSRPYAKPP